MNRAITCFAVAGLLGLLMGACSMQRSFSEPDAFLAAYNESGFTMQKQCFQQHCFEVKVQTPFFILARETAKGILKTEGDAAARAKNLEKQLFFILSLEKEDASELDANLPGLSKQQVYIEQGETRIPCSFLYDETVPGLHKGKSIHLVFDLTEGIQPNDFKLLIDHPSLGIAQFKYNLKSINELPTFTLNSTES